MFACHGVPRPAGAVQYFVLKESWPREFSLAVARSLRNPQVVRYWGLKSIGIEITTCVLAVTDKRVKLASRVIPRDRLQECLEIGFSR